MIEKVRRFFQTKRPVLLDGGFATEAQAQGADLSGGLWSARLLAEDPALIESVHRAYLKAGAQIISTSTYQIHSDRFAKSGVAVGKLEALLRRSVTLAESAVEETKELVHQDVLIAASLGPFGAILANGSEYTGDYGRHDLGEVEGHHAERIAVLKDTNADLFAFETLPRADEAHCIARLMRSIPSQPYWLSFQLLDNEHLANGDSLIDLARTLASEKNLIAIGINCLAPSLATQALKTLKKATNLPLIIYANRGEQYAEGSWQGGDESSSFLSEAQTWITQGAAAIGGCCRVGPSLIAALSCLTTQAQESQ